MRRQFKIPKNDLPFNHLSIERIVGYNCEEEFLRIAVDEPTLYGGNYFKINIAICADKLVVDVYPNHASVHFKRLQ